MGVLGWQDGMAWQDDAACQGLPTDEWFPVGAGRHAADSATRTAKRICRGCPVRADCLDYGLHEPFGIWGGLAETERRALAKRGGR